MGSVYPIIYGDIDCDGIFDIAIEGHVVSRVKTFLLAVMLIMSYHYTLNISYCKNIVNSLTFIKHVLLDIHEEHLPPKVITLIKKCE